MGKMKDLAYDSAFGRGSFYNTTGESGAQLEQYRGKAGAQELEVWRWFKDRPGKHFSPWEVQAACLPGVPITSVRRAITNLQQKGKLEKTPFKKSGPYHRPSLTWRLAGSGSR